MALIQLLANYTHQVNAGTAGTVVLLIDEPELYLHPQAIEILRESLKNLSRNNFQVIFSTHSPLLIGKDDVLNTSIVVKDANGHTGLRAKLASASNTINTHPHQAGVIFSIQNATFLLFSEKVLIAEGKTERMVIPDIYKHVNGRTMNSSKICLVEASGAGSIKPMMDILRAVGYAPKSIVDLDYVFKSATSLGLIPANDPDLIACKNWFQSNYVTHQFTINPGDALPCKGGNLSAEDAYKVMASHMSTEVGNLSLKMRQSNIWVWSGGAIEAHLGIDKTDSARINFIHTLNTNRNLNHAATPQEIVDVAHWIN